MKKRLFAALLAGVMTLSLAACGGTSSSGASSGGTSSGGASSGSSASSGSAEKYRVAYFNRDDTDEFLNVLCSGVEDLCKADDTIEFTRYDAGSDANNQLTQVEDALSKGVDCIILSVQDGQTMVPTVKKCNEQGIPVICIDISLERDSCEFDFVGSNNYDLAYAEGKYMMENLPENGKILYFRFTVGSETSRLRDEGIMDAIKDSGRTDYEILTTMEYKATQEEGMSLMEDLLQVYGDDWDALITHNDKGTYGAIAAMEAAGYDPTSKLICSIDGEEIACNLIASGKMSVSIKQDQPGMCQGTYDLLKIYQSGEKPDTDTHYIPGVAVVASNVDQYR